MTKEESKAATVAKIAKQALFDFYISIDQDQKLSKKNRALLAKNAAELFLQAIESVLDQYEEQNG